MEKNSSARAHASLHRLPRKNVRCLVTQKKGKEKNIVPTGRGVQSIRAHSIVFLAKKIDMNL